MVLYIEHSIILIFTENFIISLINYYEIYIDLYIFFP
jgi:hypothetical protein